MAEELEEELEEEEEEPVEKGNPKKVSEVKPENEFQKLVKKTCTRFHNNYVESLKKLGTDQAFINSLSKEGKTLDSCINHIMNKLTEKRIYAGEDSVMYEYIHEYYVDDFTDVADKWSNHIRANAATPAPQPVELTEEQKAEAIERATKRFEEEQIRKLEEEKRKAEEKEAQRKAKEEEKRKAKEEAERIKREAEKEAAKKAGAFEQISLF